MIFQNYSSPLGNIILSTDGKGLSGLHFLGQRNFSEVPITWRQGNDSILELAAQELHEYFAGERTHFAVPLSLQGTEFQQKVWAHLQEIPLGSVTTYGSIASAIGKAGASRAVGTAVGRNPVCIIVPCHRVIAGDGASGNYVAGAERKQWLLQHEKMSE